MHRLCVFIFAFGKLELVGESCSAFCTSSLQNFATVGGTHSFSEAVFFLSLKLLGLVCSKHFFAPPYITTGLPPDDGMPLYNLQSILYTEAGAFVKSIFAF